jgi:hypothetical protein
MKIDDLNLDYYSDFLGEKEIRFYTNSKYVVFKQNIQKEPNGTSVEYQLNQGENNIYHFTLWEGYFYTLMSELNLIPISDDSQSLLKTGLKLLAGLGMAFQT